MSPGATAAAAAQDPSKDVALITGVLSHYFDAIYSCDAALLGEVMHPAALYATLADDEVLARAMQEYLPIVAARESGESRREKRREQVVSVGLVAPTVAVAVVKLTLGELDCTDALTLVKVEGHWRVIAKVFHTEPKAV